MSPAVERPGVLFAVQVLYPLALTGSLTDALIETVRRAPDSMRASEKNAFYTALADLLLQHADQIQYASWEYLAPHEDPLDSYWGWVEGTAADAREEALTGHHDEGRYGFTTVLILADEFGRSAQMMKPLVHMEGEDGVSPDLLDHLLRLPATFDFDSVLSDVVMVRPGAGGFGVMESMLGDERYHHLGPVL